MPMSKNWAHPLQLISLMHTNTSKLAAGSCRRDSAVCGRLVSSPPAGCAHGSGQPINTCT